MSELLYILRNDPEVRWEFLTKVLPSFLGVGAILFLMHFWRAIFPALG